MHGKGDDAIDMTTRDDGRRMLTQGSNTDEVGHRLMKRMGKKKKKKKKCGTAQ